MKSAKEFKSVAKLQEQKLIEEWAARLEKVADNSIEAHEKEGKSGDVVAIRIGLNAELVSNPRPVERAFLEHFVPKAREAGWLVSDIVFSSGPVYSLSFTMQPKSEPTKTYRDAPRTRPEPIYTDFEDREFLERLERKMRLEPIWFR